MDRTLLRVSQNVRAGRGNGLPRWPARGEGGLPASARGRAPRWAGAFAAPGPVHEDAGDDRRVGDHGHDAQQRGTPRAGEGVDLVAAPEQLRLAVACCPQGPVHRISDRDGLLDREAVSRQPSAVRGRMREAGSGPPGPARVPAVVARHHLTRARNSSGSRAVVPAVGHSGAAVSATQRLWRSAKGRSAAADEERSTARRKASLSAALS